MNEVQLVEDLRIMVAYFDLRRRMRDWHGARYACVDIETIEAQLKLLRSQKESKNEPSA